MPVYKDKQRGSWYVKYSAKDPLTNKRKQILKRGFATKRDAVKWEAAQKTKGDSASLQITFAQLLEKYYAYNSPKERTQRNQTKALEKYFTGYSLPLNRLTKAFLTDWYIEFSARKDIKATTKNICISVIRSAFKFGADHYDYPNPSLPLKRFKEERLDYTTWTIGQFNQFIAAVDKPIYRLLFTFYYFTGCRQAEATGLIRSDFDLDAGTVHIQRNLKTEASNRILKLPEPLLEDLRPLLDIREDDEPVFPIPGTTLHCAFKQYIRKSGVPEIRIHDLRHSFATNAIGSGCNIVAVSRYLGHSNVNQTLRTYTHLLEKSDDELVSNIEKWMK